MSDSPNRGLDFGAGVLVGILLAVGIGGAYMFAQVREQHMRAQMEAERARDAIRQVHLLRGRPRDVLARLRRETQRLFLRRVVAMISSSCSRVRCV